MKVRGILWFAAVTKVDEARAAGNAGVDAVVEQGAEAGGHRGAFELLRAVHRQRRMQAWAGQSARMARAELAAQTVRRVWHDALSLLSQLA